MRLNVPFFPRPCSRVCFSPDYLEAKTWQPQNPVMFRPFDPLGVTIVHDFPPIFPPATFLRRSDGKHYAADFDFRSHCSGGRMSPPTSRHVRGPRCLKESRVSFPKKSQVYNWPPPLSFPLEYRPLDTFPVLTNDVKYSLPSYGSRSVQRTVNGPVRRANFSPGLFEWASVRICPLTKPFQCFRPKRATPGRKAWALHRSCRSCFDLMFFFLSRLHLGP